MRMSRCVLGVVSTALFVAGLAVAGGGDANASPAGLGAHGSGRSGVQIRSAHVDIGAQVEAGLNKIQVKNIKTGSIEPLSQVAAPGCYTAPGNQDWIDMELDVDWTYDDETLLTESSDATFSGYATCSGMVFMSIGSDVLLNGNVKANGTEPTCGTPGAASGNCADLTTFGSWSCVGVGSCNGTYYSTISTDIELPIGYTWNNYPDFCQSDYEDLLCVDDTTAVIVPNVN